MKELLRKAQRLTRISLWYFSRDRKILKEYIQKLLNEESFTLSDEQKFKEVIRIRRTIFAH